MLIPRQFNRIMKSRLFHYAAWSPVTDRYEVGDYGAFTRGVFQRLGNIRELGVDPGVKAGPSTSFEFSSAGMVAVRTRGGAEVDVFPDQSVEAELQLQFRGEESFYIRSSSVSVLEMSAVDAVARQLRRARAADGRTWNLGWRVVRKVYVAKDVTILMSASSNASFVLSGKANALRRLELGSASANIAVSSAKEDAIKIVGGTGPIALDLFRVRILGGADLESFGTPVTAPTDLLDEPMLDLELDEEWSDDPDDDDEALLRGG